MGMGKGQCMYVLKILVENLLILKFQKKYFKDVEKQQMLKYAKLPCSLDQ